MWRDIKRSRRLESQHIGAVILKLCLNENLISGILDPLEDMMGDAPRKVSLGI